VRKHICSDRKVEAMISDRLAISLILMFLALLLGYLASDVLYWILHWIGIVG